MSELKEQHNPIIEKAITISKALDELNAAIDVLAVELTPYLLPKNEEEKHAIRKGNNDESVSPLEEYLIEFLDKINYLKMKIEQTNSRIR